MALPDQPSKQDVATKYETLTVRQKEILRLFARHQRAKEIARILDISEHTVWSHVTTVKQRLGVTSTRDAALLVMAYDAAQGIPNDLPYQPLGIGEPADSPPFSGHGYARPPEIDLRDDPLDGPGKSLGNDGLTREMPVHPGDTGDSPSSQYYGDAGSSHLHDGSRDRLADRRFSLHRWLRNLSLAKWVALAGALTLGFIFIVAVAMVGLLGAFEILQRISGQKG